jgi:hypothetical protein
MAAKTECGICGTVAEHEDDFCHECGHGFSYTAGDGAREADAEPQGETCPVCHYGEIQELSYGVRQCDSCGYTARDWSPAQA